MRAWTVLLLLLSLSSFSLTGCWKGNSEPAVLDSLPVPSKDEIALVEGQPLTLTSFYAIRSITPNKDNQNILNLGIAALALQSHAKTRHQELTSEEALRIAQFAYGEISLEEAKPYLSFLQISEPPSVLDARRKVEDLVSRVTVQRNTRLLAELH